MKGVVLLEKIRSGYFTNMKDIFDAINNLQMEYNWLISDYECNHYPSKEIASNQEHIWISGEKLTEIVTMNKIQFIWGVFSGFRKDISFDDVIKYKIPFADGNKNLWENNIKTQNPLANIEIVPWDSSLVLVISKTENVIDQFIKMYPHAKDLEKYNAE